MCKTGLELNQIKDIESVFMKKRYLIPLLLGLDATITDIIPLLLRDSCVFG